MSTIKVDRAELIESYVLEDAIEDTIVGRSRWSIQHEAIIPWKAKFYKVYYSCGATEQQEEELWEHKEVVQLIEVEQRDVLVKRWVTIS